MHKKQIVVLGFIAGAALVFALLLPPQPPAAPLNSGDTIAAHSSLQNVTAAPHEPTASQSPPPSPIQTKIESFDRVHLSIIDPQGSATFDVELREGDDLCKNLERAQAEGAISSLQIDDTYLATFGSLYVREINGYTNNWTVEVNGTKPEGCSLYQPKAGDQIIWRFGV